MKRPATRPGCRSGQAGPGASTGRPPAPRHDRDAPHARAFLLCELRFLYHGRRERFDPGRRAGVGCSRRGQFRRHPRGSGGGRAVHRARLRPARDARRRRRRARPVRTLRRLRPPAATVHRLMRTLVNRGYVRQEASRRYTLGSRLIRLGEISSQMLGTWLRPFLAQLVRLTGETANLAMLDGDEVVYIAQVPSPHSMRMFTEPGRRVQPHCTAVGKALLAELPPGEARALLERDGMPAYTPATITDPDLLIAHLEVIRKQGYAVDEGEQEIGVRCFAVAVP